MKFWRKKKGIGGSARPVIKTYHKNTIFKTVHYWCTNRSTDEWNRIEDLEREQAMQKRMLVYDTEGKQHRWVGKRWLIQ